MIVGLLLALGFAFLGQAWEKAIPPERAIPTLESTLQALAEGGPAHLFPSDLFATGGKVRVVVEGVFLREAEVAALGGEVRLALPELGLWEVLVPPEALPGLARLPGVRYVRRPHRPVPLGTQGVGLSGAEAWHAAGLRGQGIRVAVIDAEFAGVEAALAQGRLRRVIARLDYTGEGFETGGGHGTACAEIIQAMAPEAELVLMRIHNEVHLARAVEDALRLGVRVISHSMAWFNTNFYDGTGVVCEMVRRATEAGILWVNAAGNFAAGAHWEGFWADSDGDGLLDFTLGVDVNTFSAEPLNPLGFWLTWDDWPATDQDFDLYVVHVPTGQVLASSTTTQAGAQPPAEHVFFVPAFPGPYGVVIHGHRVTRSLRLELFASPSLRLSQSVAESSVASPAEAPFVVSVGAIPWRRWPAGPQAAYSSQGPTNASRLNPVAHTKPDLMGPDGVDTLAYGPEGFAGTSAAAPHVAGAAALVWSAHPTWTAEQVRFWLEFTAADLGLPGKDNVYGAGRLRLPPPAVPSPPAGTSHTYAVAGWHLVSVPTEGEEAAIFGTTLWHWNGVRYEAVAGQATVSALRGYWAQFPSAQTVQARGTVPTRDQALALERTGWHLVSVPWPFPKEAIQVSLGGIGRPWAEAVAAGWVGPNLWGYDPAARCYFAAETLEPWQGYWLYSRAPGLVLRFAHGARGTGLGGASALAVEDSPPPPPHLPLPTEPQFLVTPNPWTGNGPLRFSVVSSVPVTTVMVEIFDVSGKQVWKGEAQGGEVLWHGMDAQGAPLANGAYVCVFRVRSGERLLTSKPLTFVILR